MMAEKILIAVHKVKMSNIEKEVMLAIDLYFLNVI